MPDLIAKIGSDSTQFRNDVQALPGIVNKSFQDMKAASEGGLQENLKGLKRGFNDLKDLFLGAGIITGVKKFFDLAIEGAQASKDATDANAQAVLRFADSLKSLSGTTANVAKEVVGFFNGIGESIGGAARDAYDYWIHGSQTLVTNLRESEKAAREQEQALAKMKSQAAEWNKLNAEAKSLIEARNAAEMKALPLTEQRAVLQEKLMAAQRAETEAADRSLEKKTAQVEQIRVQNQLLEVGRNIDADIEKSNMEARKHVEAMHQVELDSLGTNDRINALKQDIADIEQYIASGVLSTASNEYQKELLMDRQVALAKALNDQKKEEADIAEKLKNQQAELAEKEAERLKRLKPITAELQKQLDLMNHVNDRQYLNEGGKYQLQIGGKTYNPARDQSFFNDLSDEVLAEIIRRNQKEIANLEASKMTASTADMISGYLSQSQAQGWLQTEIIRAQAVAGQRKQLRGVNMSTALKNFGGDLGEFDRLYSSQNASGDTLRTIANGITNIDARLRGAGFKT